MARIPKLYETEGTPLGEKIIYEHFFIGNSDWYIAEYDGEDIFFGYAILGGDLEMAEWGYISFEELKEIKIPPGFEVERDLYWNPKKAKDIKKIMWSDEKYWNGEKCR